MELSDAQLHLSAADVRRASLAHGLRATAKISQLIVLVALYVLWKPLHVPFWTAVEWCCVAGVSAYTALVLAAAVLLVIARIQPVVVVVAHLTRLASVGIYAALRFVHGMGLIRSVAVWAALYLVAGLLARRIERRARRRLGI